MQTSLPSNQKTNTARIHRYRQSYRPRYSSYWPYWIYRILSCHPLTLTMESHIYALKTTANREDQVLDFVTANVQKKKLQVYSLIRPHGLRGYIFLEAESKQDAEESYSGIPYARGLLPREVAYNDIKHMLEQGKKEITMQKGDIVEIISGPFKRDKAKITRIDEQKEEVVVEILEAAVPIPVTVSMDAVKVIRREGEEEVEEDND